MNNETQEKMISSSIQRIEKAADKMKDADALRAVRTLSHLEAQLVEIKTGKKARAW